MVEVGNLVKEHSSQDSPTRLGTVTKVTDIILNKHSSWEAEVKSWRDQHERLDPSSDLDMSGCFIIRPGHVASVRWQDNAKLTIHVFYADAGGLSTADYHSNTIEVFAPALGVDDG